MNTTLINLRTYRGPADYVLIDRRTVYGNHKYKMGEWSDSLGRKLTREDCVALFRMEFETKMKTSAGYQMKIEQLHGKKLACWCTPLACHGDVYVEYLEKGPWW